MVVDTQCRDDLMTIEVTAATYAMVKTYPNVNNTISTIGRPTTDRHEVLMLYKGAGERSTLG